MDNFSPVFSNECAQLARWALNAFFNASFLLA